MAHKRELAPINAIEESAQSIDPRWPLEKRYEHTQELKQAIQGRALAGNLLVHRYYSDEPEKPLTPDDVDALTVRHSFIFYYADRSSISGILSTAVETICITEEEKKLMEAIGSLDQEALTKNRLQYGAKGANLLAAKELLKKLEGTNFKYIATIVSIPPFSLIDTETYRAWKRGEDIVSELHSIYAQYKGKPLKVRSSAVYSEDGERMTGAGLYKTVSLACEATFEQFQQAVITVYESVDSQEATEYRQEHGVAEEYMGVVVQECVEYLEIKYINSTRPYTDDTLDVKSDKGRTRFVFDTPSLDHNIFLHKVLRDTLGLLKYSSRLPLEVNISSDWGITFIVAFARFLEKYYGQPVQIELGTKQCAGKDKCYFLQVRPLPQKMFEGSQVEFPSDREPLYECAAVGICDDEFDVLDAQQDNNKDKTGMVVFRESYCGSLPQKRRSLIQAMPQQGVIMIWALSAPGHGHIETLALERGIILLYPGRRPEESVVEAGMNATQQSIDKCLQFGELGSKNEFYGHSRVRVIADGKKARIYAIV